MNLKVKQILLGFLLLQSVGCGGGTSGTSSTDGYFKVVRGTVRNKNDQAVSNAAVTVDENKDSVTTDIAGGFSLSSRKQNVALTINAESGTTKFNVEDLIDQPSALNLALEIGDTQEESRISGAEFTVIGVIGQGCADKFGPIRAYEFLGNGVPLLVVDQTAQIESGTSCFLQVQVSTVGSPTQPHSLELYGSAASLNSGVRIIGSDQRINSQKLVSTAEVRSDGVVEVGFIFKEDPETGFYLLEVSSGLPRTQRVGIVINLLN